jgi:hypothetical protein
VGNVDCRLQSLSRSKVRRRRLQSLAPHEPVAELHKDHGNPKIFRRQIFRHFDKGNPLAVRHLPDSLFAIDFSQLGLPLKPILEHGDAVGDKSTIGTNCFRVWHRRFRGSVLGKTTTSKYYELFPEAGVINSHPGYFINKNQSLHFD